MAAPLTSRLEGLRTKLRGRLFAGLSAFSTAGLAARVLSRGRRVFFSPVAEVAREEDGASSSDLGGRAMSWVSEGMTAGALCVRRGGPGEVSGGHEGVDQTVDLRLEERGRTLVPQD